MNKKTLSPLITGLCCVAAITSISVYTDKSNNEAVPSLAAVPSGNAAYDVIISSEETTIETAVTEYISETPAFSENADETTPITSVTAAETAVTESEITSAETSQTSAVTDPDSETKSEQTSVLSDNGDIPAGDVYVILNTKTKCIHVDADCQHAKKISDENRKEGYSDISALSDMGYWACGSCAKDYREIAPKP